MENQSMRNPLEYLQIAVEVKNALPAKFNTLSTPDKITAASKVLDILVKHNVTLEEVATLLHQANGLHSLFS